MHQISVRVYYEDTDLAGIVYYANYLRFIERARTEALREYGVDQTRLLEDDGIVFAVRRVVMDYLAPARFDDLLTVTTEVTRLRAASVEMHQAVRRGESLLAQADVTIACIKAGLQPRPLRIPGEIHAMLSLLAGATKAV